MIRLRGRIAVLLNVVITVRHIAREHISFVDLDFAVGITVDIDRRGNLIHVSARIHLEKTATGKSAEYNRYERYERREFEK